MKDKNVIVFSVSFDFYNDRQLYNRLSIFRMFFQLLECIKSIRKFSNIKIILFYSPHNIFDSLIKYFNKQNVTLVAFDNDSVKKEWNNKIDSLRFSGHLHHRWINLIKTFDMFECEKVLYLDTDVLFYNNPELLFEKYNKDICYFRTNERDFSILQHTNKVPDFPEINDGVVIVSKTEINKIKDNFEAMWINKISEITELVYEDMQRNLDKATNQPYNNYMWNISQYAAYLLIKENNLNFESFSSDDVVLSGELDSIQNKDNVIVHHYYSTLMDKYLIGESI